MLTRTCELFHRYGCGAIVLAALLVGGCGVKSAKLPTYVRPDLLYLTDQPYTRLYVEVDVMEGVEVSQKWLDEFEAFLTQHCSKPDGITIVRDEPVPISTIADVPKDLLAILCTDGPPEQYGDETGYLHLVFLDSKHWSLGRACPAGVIASCPTAILCNADRGFDSDASRTAGAFLRHEAGHVLGLCSNPEHGDRSHCHNYGCLMAPAPTLGSWIGAKIGRTWKPKLCEDCDRDLENAWSQPSPNNLSFAGPFLVRHEGDYDVISLGHSALLSMCPTGEAYNWRAILAQAKKNIRERIENRAIPRKYKGTLFQCEVMASADIARGSEQYQAILREVAQDPSAPLSRCAQTLLKKQTGANAKKGTSP